MIMNYFATYFKVLVLSKKFISCWNFSIKRESEYGYHYQLSLIMITDIWQVEV